MLTTGRTPRRSEDAISAADHASPTGVPANASAARPLLTPGRVVAALLLVCVVKGAWLSAGVVVPPDPDTVRDLGFIQGVRDGDWFHDPTTGGALRWYPPLLHDLAALLTGALRLPLFDTWLHAGAVLNLLTPLSFYWMNRCLIGLWPAATATVLLVLFGGVLLPSDAVTGYTPWTLTPALAWPMFFVSVRLIATAVERCTIAGAVLVGSCIGVVFLAHTVPAVLLAGMTTVAARVVQGKRWLTLLWLACAAAVALAWAAPFLLPLVVTYRLHIANAVPGSWVHPVLSQPLTLVPNLLGVVAAIWLLTQRIWLPLPRGTIALFAAWITLCLIPLGRHYACDGRTDGVCGVFVVAVHHYLAYLQPAWASLIEVALVRLTNGRVPTALLGLAIAACGIAAVLFMSAPEDQSLRRLGSIHPELVLDRAAYAWILANTRPEDLFVTELPPNPADMGPGAATVMAAGRRLVAPPEMHSNPYVAWEPRNARRLEALRPGADLCPLLREAADANAFLLLPAGQKTDATPVFRSPFSTIYSVPRGVCGA